MLYEPPLAKTIHGLAPLEPDGFLIVGENSTGFKARWSFDVLEEKVISSSILQEKQDQSVGFLKLFLTTQPVDMSRLHQQSPFISETPRGIHREECPSGLADWCTLLIRVDTFRSLPKFHPTQRRDVGGLNKLQLALTKVPPLETFLILVPAALLLYAYYTKM